MTKRWGITIPLGGIPLPYRQELITALAVRGFTAGLVADGAPPVLVAALRPGTLRLAGREGDGAQAFQISGAMALVGGRCRAGRGTPARHGLPVPHRLTAVIRSAAAGLPRNRQPLQKGTPVPLSEIPRGCLSRHLHDGLGADLAIDPVGGSCAGAARPMVSRTFPAGWSTPSSRWRVVRPAGLAWLDRAREDSR